MPFQFDPAEYKNKFTATVVASELKPNDNDPTKEVWYATLLRVKPNATRTEWEPIEGMPCQLPGCVNIKPWHTHARWYESDRQFSPAHKFVDSIKDKGKTDPGSGPSSILNKTYVWEEEITPERRNPNTGGVYKEQRNYYISGVGELSQGAATSTVTHNGTDTIDLPWDAPVTTGATTTVTAVVTPPPTQATVAAPPLTYEEAAIQIAETIMDGKTHEEVRQAIVGNATFRSVPSLLFKFVNGTMVQELKDNAMIEQDANGVFHLPANEGGLPASI